MLDAAVRRGALRQISVVQILIACHLILWSEAVRCPGPCKCIEENDGERLDLICDQGGIQEPTFQKILQQASPRTTHIRIVAPRERPNNFSLSANLNRFKNLEELYLVNCGITSLGQSVFSGLRTLRTLNVANNKISHLSIDTFFRTGHLEHLNLNGNLFSKSYLPNGVFTYLKRLRTLSLKGNNIVNFPHNFLFGLNRLESLNMDGNKLDSELLAQMLADVPGLEQLEVNGCCLKGINADTFKRVSNLHRLGIGYNGLGHVPVGALEPMDQLKYLSLAGNNITFLPAYAFNGVPIGNLDLSDNNLGEGYVPNSILREGYGITPQSLLNSSIVRLDLSKNGYRDFDAGMILGETGASIQVLYLSENPLGGIKEEHTNGLKLRSLHLAKIGMKSIPVRLPETFQHLQLLNLSGNGIDKIPYRAAKHLAPTLRHLDVSNCEFSAVSTNIFSLLIAKLDSFYVHGNPWDCNCHIIQLRDYFRDPRRTERCKLLRLDQIRCASPAQLAGRELVTLDEPTGCAVIFGSRSGLTQQSEIGILVAGALAFFLLISLGVLIACWSKLWRKAGTYRTREDSRNQLSPSDSDHSDMILPHPPPSSAKERLF